MSAVINQRATSSTAAPTGNVKRPELIQKVEGQVARVIQFLLLDKEEGFLTISEDKSLRVLLKRDSGQFWPSVIEYVPSVPTSLCLHEESLSLFVGLVNGSVYQYLVSEDWNSLELVRRLAVHRNAVSAVAFSAPERAIFSCSRDKTLAWHSTETGNMIGSYMVNSACSTMQYDSSSSFAFVGDLSGSIFVLRVSGSTAQLVSKLSAHTAAISDLAWNAQRQLLFSASTDTLVIMWDIGGKKGECYELCGHDSKLTSLALAAAQDKLFSVDDTGHLMCWDLKPRRVMAPAWVDNDNCQLCDVPFFWNVKVMWDRKVVGVRRHHCRTCGVSVCGNCCNQWTVFPAMGFEKPARICRTCKRKMEDHPEQFDLTPLASSCELKQGVVDMRLQISQKKLATVGFDRAILVWNVEELL